MENPDDPHGSPERRVGRDSKRRKQLAAEAELVAARKCRGCGADISHRAKQARYCAENACAELRRKAVNAPALTADRRLIEEREQQTAADREARSRARIGAKRRRREIRAELRTIRDAELAIG